MQEQVRNAEICRWQHSEGPVDVSLYCDPQRRVGLIFKADTPLKRDFNFANLKIEKRRTENRKWQFILKLLEPSLEANFSILCSQIVNGIDEKNVSDGGGYLAGQIARWTSLMRKSMALGPETERGLFGELCILQQAIIRYGERNAVAAWVGPEDAPQDFLFEDGAAEVKTLFEKAGEIKISSLDQLDPVTESLYLVVVGLAQNETGFTLAEKVNELKEKFIEDPEIVVIFEEKLMNLGFSEKLGKVGSTTKYSTVSCQWYDASAEDFPALRRRDVDASILKANYSLAVVSISEFKTEGLF